MILVTYCYEHGKFLRGDEKCSVCIEEKDGHSSGLYSLTSSLGNVRVINTGGHSAMRSDDRYHDEEFSPPGWDAWQRHRDKKQREADQRVAQAN